MSDIDVSDNSLQKARDRCQVENQLNTSGEM